MKDGVGKRPLAPRRKAHHLADRLILRGMTVTRSSHSQSPPMVRAMIGFVIFGLLVSGITAFPLQTEMQWLCRLLGIAENSSPDRYHGLRQWIAVVTRALIDTNRRYPFLAYGTDWLAFAHMILAILFIGPWRDPVRNIWVIDFGIIACLGVIPLAVICGPIRGIPFGWTCIDCSFGIVAIVPLWFCRKRILKMEQDTVMCERQETI